MGIVEFRPVHQNEEQNLISQKQSANTQTGVQNINLYDGFIIQRPDVISVYKLLSFGDHRLYKRSGRDLLVCGLPFWSLDSGFWAVAILVFWSQKWPYLDKREEHPYFTLTVVLIGMLILAREQQASN